MKQGDTRAEGRAHAFCAFNFDPALRDVALEHAQTGRALAERSRDWGWIADATTQQCFAALPAGDWDTVREAATRGLEVNPRKVELLAMMAELELQCGNLAQSLEYRTRVADRMESVRGTLDLVSFPWFTISAAMHSYVTGTDEYLTRVEQVGQLVASSPQTTPLFASVTHPALGIRAFLTGDQEAAREQLARLERFAGSCVWGLTVDHVRGLLFETLGQTEEAIEAIETTLAYPQIGYGFRVYWSWAAYDCARIRIARDASGDRERARTLIDEALGHAQKLGMRPLIDKLVALKMQDQGISTITDIYTSIDVVAESVGRERPEIATHAAPDGTVTIMFSDIEDSTVLTERLGDQAWQDLLRKHNALIREQLRAHDGYEVKTMGDGFMVAFRSAKKGLDCAIAIQKAFDGHNAADGEHVKVRIGLHAGEAIKDGDDFYGKNVILASRVAGKAVGGEILVSSLLRQLVESSVGVATFSEPRNVELKGLSGTHTVYAVRPKSG